MRALVVVYAVLLVAGPVSAYGVEVGVDGTTLVRIEERSFPDLPEERLVPATQYMGLNVAGLTDGNLSLHFYGWGRHDFGDVSAGSHKNDGELSYGYLRYRFPKADAEIKAGRFFVNEGVAHEQLDGIFTRADLAYGFTASLFGGAPVRLYGNDNKGDYLLGGRLAYRRPGLLEIGASMLHDKGAASSRYTQSALPTVSNVDDNRQLVGADVWLAAGSKVELTGMTTYNTSASAIAEHNYLLQIKPVKEVTVTGTYSTWKFNGSFADTNLPGLFRPDVLDDSTRYGGSVAYALAEPVEVAVDYQRIRRASLGATDRFGIDTRFVLKRLSSRAGLGYHRYSAPDVATALPTGSYNMSFNQIRGWVLYERNRCVASLDVIGHIYDDRNNPNLNGKGSDYEAAVSIGYRVLQNLLISGDLNYGANPRLREEFRAVARAEFSYSTASGKGGTK